MSSNIENIIAELEAYIADCKPSRFSKNSIIVNRDDIESLLDELKSKTPDEIRKYQKIINNKDAILNDARSKAQSMIDQAQVRTDELISEHEIMQRAYAQADEVVRTATEQARTIVDRATMEANEYRQSAQEYTDNLLASIEALLANAIDVARNKEDSFINSMQGYLDVVINNRIAIYPEAYTQEEAANDAADAGVQGDAPANEEAPLG